MSPKLTGIVGVHLYWQTKQYQSTSALQTQSLKQSRSFALPFYFPRLSVKRVGRGQSSRHNFFSHFKIYFREQKGYSLKTPSPHPVEIWNQREVQGSFLVYCSPKVIDVGKKILQTIHNVCVLINVTQCQSKKTDERGKRLKGERET